MSDKIETILATTSLTFSPSSIIVPHGSTVEFRTERGPIEVEEIGEGRFYVDVSDVPARVTLDGGDDGSDKEYLVHDPTLPFSHCRILVEGERGKGWEGGRGQVGER